MWSHQSSPAAPPAGASDRATPAALGLCGVHAQEQLRYLDSHLEARRQDQSERMSDRPAAPPQRRRDCMLDASDEDTVATLDERVHAWPMHIVQCQLQLGHEEHIEHVFRLAQRDFELANDARELVDHA